MQTRTTLMLLLLCLAGFAFSLYNAGDRSGTEDGNLWLLTSLILGVGLISTCLAVIAQFGRLKTLSTAAPDRYVWRGSAESRRETTSHQAADRVDSPREHHHSTAGREQGSVGR